MFLWDVFTNEVVAKCTDTQKVSYEITESPKKQ